MHLPISEEPMYRSADYILLLPEIAHSEPDYWVLAHVGVRVGAVSGQAGEQGQRPKTRQWGCLADRVLKPSAEWSPPRSSFGASEDGLSYW